MANLPSNTAGMLSSEMYSIITDFESGESFLVGQGPPFNHFFYIRLNFYTRKEKMSHFELVFDFGRKLMAPGETIDLDEIIMAKGELAALQENYFSLVRKKMRIKIPSGSPTGWCTWYYYFNHINPQSILENLAQAQKRKLPLDYFQIDDGYQKMVGDWLDLTPEFEGRMRYLSDSIRKAGYRPGIWIAPFVADKKSTLARHHPEYLLRNEFGKPIVAGYNVFWPGHWYYGLDITNPRFEEYIRRVIRTLVREWGFTYLKCDFLFGGCLRGGTHNDLTLSRAEVLKRGMAIIRQEAGRKAVLVGCGMPLSTGIGTVDAMRVGPDTGPYWRKLSGALLNTGAMVGARNSIRNVLVRSAMHRQLWLNDPDCLMIRKKKTRLRAAERFTQINAIILSGGLLLYSDDLAGLSESAYNEMETITALSRECAGGTAVAIDLMEREIPELYYNSAGYLGVFNFLDRSAKKKIDLSSLPEDPACELVDIWTGETIEARDGPIVSLGKMPPHSSRLFKLKADS
jgi:alpha-galactosidase